MSSTSFVRYEPSVEQASENNEASEESVVERAPSGRSACPECDGRVVSENQESYCVKCGLVVSAEHVDRQPMLRVHGPSDDSGPAEWSCESINPLRIDKGLHTTFFLGSDGYGNSLSSEQKDKFGRLRRRHKRFQVEDKRAIRLNEGFRDIESITGNLALPGFVAEDAGLFLKQAADARLPGGRMSWEALAGGAVLLAATESGFPRSCDEVVQYTKSSYERVSAAARKLRCELGLDVPPAREGVVEEVLIGIDDVLDVQTCLELRELGDHFLEIASLDENPDARTGGVIDNRRWYDYRSNADDFDALEEGYDHFGSPKLLPDAADEITGQRGGRVLYALTTYSPVMGREEPCRFTEDSDGDRSSEWRTEGPLPNYDELAGQTLIHDVDVADDYKERPLPAKLRDVVEAALEVYVDRFADLAGSRDHVLLLDSVGGAYPMIPPAATAPLAEEFLADRDRGLLYEELCTRMDEWLADVWTEVQESVSGAAEYLDPDDINNKNRQYKTVLSVHKSIDGVVTPIDVDDVCYEHVPVREVGDEEIAAAREWAESLTADRHREAIAPIVETLWPDYSADADTWVQALQEWLLDRESDRIRKEQRREERMEALRDGEVVELQTADVTLTTDQSDVEAALNALDPERVIDDTILGAGWTDRLSGTKDRSGDGRRAFVPTWTASYNSGNATFVGVSGQKEGVWYDSSGGYKGGFVEAALIAHDGRSPGAGFASGENWREGVAILRRLGYDIPVWIPDASSLNEDQMPLWALRKFALKLGIVEQHELVERSGDDGSSYLGFRPSDYRRVVRRAEAAGLDTGRTDHLDDAPTSEYYDADLQAYTATEQSPYADPDVMLAACLRARDDGAVPEDADPPTLALIPIVRDAGMRNKPGDMSSGTRAMAVDVYREDLGASDVQDDDTVKLFE